MTPHPRPTAIFVLRIALLSLFLLSGAYGFYASAVRTTPHLPRDPSAGLNQTAQTILGIPHFVQTLRRKTNAIPAGDLVVVVSADNTWTRAEVYRLATVALYPRRVVLWNPNAAPKQPPAKIGALLFYHAAPFPGLAPEPLGDEAAVAILHRTP